jgi:DNA modification methylase
MPKIGPYEISGFYTGDCRELLREVPNESIQCCVTSPPYWGLRDYKVEGQLGLEDTPEQYVESMVDVFREVRRVLRADGTLWLNLGDSYSGDKSGGRNDTAKMYGEQGQMLAAKRKLNMRSGLKPKDLCGIPWRVAFALQADGWYLRSDIIWHKSNPMPESVTDRPTKSHEYLFLMLKSARYFYDADAIGEPMAPASASRYEYAFGGAKNEALVEANRDGVGQRTRPVGNRIAAEKRNKRSVWTVATTPYSAAHFAVFPPALIEPCILAGTKPGDIVLDPFFGSGTTGQVAEKYDRRWLGFDLNPEYAELQAKRTAQRTIPGVS